MRRDKKVLMFPVRFAVLYMVGTLFVYLLGPIDYHKGWDWYEFLGVGLVSLYILALYCGFRQGVFHRKEIDRESAAAIQKHNVDGMLKVIGVFMIVDFLVTMLNALLYVGVGSLSELLSAVLKGLSDPAGSYYGKDSSSRAGNILVYITILLQPILFVSRVYSLLLWKKIKPLLRVLCVCTILVEACRWLAIGTNKGLFDIVMLIVSIFLIKSLNGKYNGTYKKMNKKVLLAIAVLVVLFLWFFSYAISSRIGGAYNHDAFAQFPYNLIPESMRVLVEKVDSYLTQGYFNMIACIEKCEWKPTFFIGNSRFLMDMLNRFTGIDITGNTYPYQLEEFGVNALASWHTAYAWWASDFSFIGVVAVMYFIGQFWGAISYESIVELNPVSCTLFYMVFLGVVFASCNNCVLAYSSMWFGCVGLIVFRFFRRRTALKHVHFTI